jgi:hypothetical protein
MMLGTGFYTFKECNKTQSLRNHTATAHKERERLEDRRNVGESSCNSGDGTGQTAQPFMFMMMMMMMSMLMNTVCLSNYVPTPFCDTNYLMVFVGSHPFGTLPITCSPFAKIDLCKIKKVTKLDVFLCGSAAQRSNGFLILASS